MRDAIHFLILKIDSRYTSDWEYRAADYGAVLKCDL